MSAGIHRFHKGIGLIAALLLVVTPALATSSQSLDSPPSLHTFKLHHYQIAQVNKKKDNKKKSSGQSATSTGKLNKKKGKPKDKLPACGRKGPKPCKDY